MTDAAVSPPRIVFAAVTAATIVGQLGLIFAPFLVLLAMRQTGLNDDVVSRIIAGEFVAYLLTALFASSTRTFPHARVTMIAALAYASGSFIAAYVTDPDIFAGARILCGIGGGAIMVSANRLIASHLKFDRLFAFAIIGTAIFAIVGLLLVPAALQEYGSGTTYITLGAFALVAAALSRGMVAGSRVPKKSGLRVGVAPWFMLAAYFLSRLCDALLWPYIERFGERVGIDTFAVGAVLSGATILAIVGPLIALRTNRFSQVIALFVFALVGKSVAPLAMAASPTVAAFVGTQFTVSFCLVLAGQLFLTHFSAVDAGGRLAGLGGTVGLLADAFGVVLAGMAFSAGGFTGVAAASAAAGLIAVLLCVPALVFGRHNDGVRS